MNDVMPYDKRNVVDHFKYWNKEAINAVLECKAHNFSVAMEHWTRDLNIGSFIRNSNAFAARETHYIGQRNYDRRGTVGTHHYVRLQHHKSVEDFVTLAKEKSYTILAVDNVNGAKAIETYDLPEMSMFVFGEESTGITDKMRQAADDLVYIKQYGSVRSLNAGVASGVVMYEWVKQHG